MAYITNTYSDKNIYTEKRIHSTGTNLAKKFKNIFNY
jgi:hypothetical protein